MPFSSLLGSIARMWLVLEASVIIFVSRFVSSANLHFKILVQMIAVSYLLLNEPSFAEGSTTVSSFPAQKVFPFSERAPALSKAPSSSCLLFYT